jgi:uncharacterized protein YdeI (BOF family)
MVKFNIFFNKFISKSILILTLFLFMFALTGCVKSIEDLKNDDMIDKRVTVRGTVEGSIKIGSFSGYSIRDDTGNIGVVSDKLPEDGQTVTVKGTLRKLFVYYIEAD